MSRVRVKICGLTRRQDVDAAITAGADALGFVFYEKSPRNVSIEQAARLTSNLPPFVQAVGLFVDASREFVQAVLENTGINCLQFHGDEAPDACVGYQVPVIKALRVKPDMDVATYIKKYENVNGVLLDTYHPKLQGGTGESFNWQQVPKDLAMPIILAGGLNAENVTKAIEVTHPYAVDVSGGVESEKGIKDVQKIDAFIRGVKSV